MDEAIPVVLPTVAATQAALKPFLDANPSSSIEEEEIAPGIKSLMVKRPWDDRSLMLEVPKDILGFAEALNNLHLPPRYSGVWHSDTKAFEIIWTAFKTTGNSAECVGRKFSFRFRGQEYECEFARSSDRVLAVAAAMLPAGQTETGYRNLWSFWVYHAKKPAELVNRIGDPVSFWIRNVEWNEDEVLALVTHLNFYIDYFDASSPVVVLHSPQVTTAKKPTRYPAGSFPLNINSTEIDAALLYLWEAASVGEPMPRFLYYYRIIEYSAAVYLDTSSRTALRIALALPNALDDLTAVTESVVAAVQRIKMDEFARYETMLKDVVDPKLLWREISLNVDAFTSDTQFDGGYKVSALFSAGRTVADFTLQDVATFARTIREMRNALSHGRDQKTSTTILPTTHNAAKLQPWIAPIRLCASQVILYKGVF